MSDQQTSKYNIALASPYTVSEIEFTTTLYPHQMDNKFYIHLKNNITKQFVGKNYETVGFVKQIYKITDQSDGIIEPEDTSASAKYVVKAICRICMPKRNREIVCKIDKMNNELIGASFGPVNIIIKSAMFNHEKFIIDSNRHLKYITNTAENIIVQPNMFIRVLIFSSKFNKNEDRIISLGMLMDIANMDEIEWFNKENDNEKMSTFEEYDECN